MEVPIRCKIFRRFFLLALLLVGGIFYGQCPTVTNPNQSFCDLQSPTVANLAAINNGGGIAWFSSPTGGTALPVGTGLVSGATYYVDNAAGNCGNRQPVNVTVYGPPIGLNFQGVCVGAAGEAVIADLIATGNNVQWYATPSGGSPLAPGTVLSDNTIYYASQTNPDTGCETSRLSVFVNVGIVPIPTGPKMQQFCFDPAGPPPTVANLVASGANNWYATSTSAVVLPLDMPLVSGESYYATTVDPPCESIERLEVFVTLVPPNDSGTDGTRRICANEVATTAPFNLFEYLGGTPDTNGTWSGPLATVNGHLGTLDPSTMTLGGSPYTFTYTVTGLCAPTTSTVTIEILPLPTATVAATQTICSGAQATVTFTGTPNATVTYNINGGANQTVVLDASGSATLTTTYTATTVINLVSVASAGPPSCSTPLTGSITINVAPLPTATIASNQTICQGESATITITGTPNAAVTYTVNGGANQIAILNASGVATITGTYSATTTFTLVNIVSSGTPSCSQPLTGSAVITVTPTPTVSISSDSTICPNGSATVTFTGTPNAVVTYTVNGGGNQTITLNAAGTAAITQTYAATTTYTLLSVATAGTPSCVAPAAGSVTITVLPPPTATIAANATICSGQSATVTFTGSANATVTYTVNGGANQTIVLDATGTATIAQTFTSTTTYTLVSVASAGTPSCTATLNQQITITVLPLPTVSITSNQTICSGQQATVTFTGTPNAIITFTVNGVTQTISLDAAGTATLTNTYTANTTISLVSAATTGTPGCSQPQTGSVVITVIQPPTASISSSQTICSGQQATVTFTGTPNSVVTYTVNGGANQTITLNAAGTATITETYTATTTYTLVSVSVSGTPSCPAAVSGSITITVAPLPVASIASDQTICSGQQATVTFTGTPNAVVTYTVNGGTNLTIALDASGTAVITEIYMATTTYTLVSVSTAGTPACSQPQTGSVTITVLPQPMVSIASDQTICSGDTATVTFTGTPGAIVTFTVNGVTQTITLNASGTGTITQTYTESTIYELVSVATGGTPSCSVPAAGSIAITIPPPPSVTISGDTSVCPGETATITFSGPANAVVVYNVNGGANQTITLDATGSATISQVFAVTTVYTVVSVTLGGTPACSAPSTVTHTVNVLPPPTASATGAVTICSGDDATLTFTGTPNAVVTYTANGVTQTVTLDASGNAMVTGPYIETTTIVLTNVANSGTPGCSQTLNQTFVVTVIPLPSASLSAATTICSGSSASAVITGTPNAVVTYTVNGGAPQTITIGAGGTVTIPGTYTSDTVIALAQVTSAGTPSCTQTLTQTTTITVIPLPTAAIAAQSTTVCTGTAATVIITGTPGATVTYTINGGANQFVTLDAAGTAVLTDVLTANATYTLVSASTAGTPVCSQTLSGSVTITASPAPQAGNDVAEFAVCQTGTPVDLFTLLGPDAQPGGTWSPALASGTGVFNPMADPAGTYVYTVGAGGVCPVDTASVTVTIVTPANAGNDATLDACTNQDPIDLFTLLGPTAQPGGTWSPALAGGGSVFDPAIDIAGNYTYTVNGNAACGTDSAVVAVTLTPGPDAGQDGTMTLCVNSDPEDLFDFLNGTPQPGGTWSPALASGTGVFNPAVDAPGVYTYTFFGNQPCDNDTATVTVTVNPVPDAGTSGNAFFCTNHAPADLITFLGGAPQPGGTWSPALASGTGVFNPAVDPAGVYTYSVGGNLCDLSTATVTVTLGQSPDAGGPGATLDVCFNVTSVDLFDGLDGTQGVGTWSDDDGTGALTGNIFNPSAVGVGTYHFTYTVGGGTSPCFTDTATVTVVVSPQPEAGTFIGIESVCTSAGTFDLMTLLSGAQVGGEWTNASGVVTNPLDISTMTAGTYTYTYTITNGCGTDSVQVQLTILPIPTITIPNITLVTPICVGADATVTITGIPNGTYTLTYDLSGANTATAQTVSVTIAGGSGSFAIPSALLSNLGTTTITFTMITNDATTCSNALTGVLVNVVTNPTTNMDDGNLSAVDVCLGSAVTVSITGATGIPNGTYQFNYSIPGAVPSTGSSPVVTITNNAGQFTIPGTTFPSAGNYTITITGIIGLSGGCTNLNEDASTTVTILPSPNIAGVQVTAADVCVGTDAQVLITGATSLTDGTYTITYVLSGAVSGTYTQDIVFTGGASSFDITGAILTSEGTVAVLVQSLTSSTGLCGASGGSFPAASFDIDQPGTPVLIPNGHEFCSEDNPTVANLSANVQGGGNVIWYNAPTGGTAYADNTPLVNGTTYYGAYVLAGGCESEVRLEVTVDTTVCELDILIPDGFSPNGDNINDNFVIVNLRDVYPNFKLEIYNRYGNILYKGNAATPDWDGTAQQGGVKLGDGEVPVGVYFYILEFNDGVRKPKQGRLYLSR